MLPKPTCPVAVHQIVTVLSLLQFAVLLGIIFILEISAGIAAYVMRDQVRFNRVLPGRKCGLTAAANCADVETCSAKPGYLNFGKF